MDRTQLGFPPESYFEDDRPDKYVYECDICGAHIYDGDSYYRIGTERVCEDCIDDYKKIASWEDLEH